MDCPDIQVWVDDDHDSTNVHCSLCTTLVIPINIRQIFFYAEKMLYVTSRIEVRCGEHKH